jgi:8-oxo-dGTP diphosphatase
MAYKTIAGITSSVIPFYIEDGECFVLLGKRKDSSNAYPGCWCIVGGFLEPDRETLEQTAVRELQEETGLIISTDSLNLVVVQSSPKRDPRGHIIDNVFSVAFEGRIEAEASDDLAAVKWFSLENALQEKLAFDHEESLYLFGVKEGLL